MAHTYSICLFHCVFSVKYREPLLTADLRGRLWSYMVSTARQKGVIVFVAGGFVEHVHLALSVPSSMAIARAIGVIKGSSSRWINDSFDVGRRFAWQEGYGAFSIGASQLAATIRYINDQPRHHERRSLDEELASFNKAHDILLGQEAPHPVAPPAGGATEP